MIKKILISILLFTSVGTISAQDVNQFVQNIRSKLSAVKDYQAEGTMKLDVPFLQVPDSKVSIYYKSPDKFSIRQQKGVSLIPKGGVSININTLLTNGKFTAVDAGTSTLENKSVRVIKLLPLEENSDVVLTTLYVDPIAYLVRKGTITTKENGTYEVQFSYGSYSSWALPDDVTFTFNTKDYKMPKGVTFDYDEEDKPEIDKIRNTKGSVKIHYSSYTINKGVSEDFFKKN